MVFRRYGKTSWGRPFDDLQNASSQAGHNQLDGKLCCAVLNIESRIEFNQVYRAYQSGLGQKRKGQMDFAVIHATAGGGADTGGNFGIQHIKIK